MPVKSDTQVQFSDNVLMGSWLDRNKEKLEELSQTNDIAKAIINELNRRQRLGFEEKIEKAYKYLQETGKLPFLTDSTIKFSDGVLIGGWLFDNKNKIEELSQTNEQAKAIINELNKRKGLSFEEKLEETYKYLQDMGKIPVWGDKQVQFRDNTLMGNWLNNNKQKIYELYLNDDDVAVKFVNVVLELKPKYFDKVKDVIMAKKEFEKGSEKEVSNGPKI